MEHPMTFAGGADGPSADLYDAIAAFQSAAGARPSSIEALEELRGSAAVEAAAEIGMLELLCEQGHGNRVAATWAEFRVAGSPTRSWYLNVMRRLAERYVPQV